MASTRRGDWLALYTGGSFYPLDPRPDEITPRDIAHALSLQCRFAGHVQTFYSVAEHSVHLSRAVPACDALWALLHDASEAYLVDVPRPVKAALPDYRQIEVAVQRAVATRFGLTWPLPASVAEADTRILHNERAALLTRGTRAWGLPGTALPGLTIQGWVPWVAEQHFIDRLIDLGAL